jgi:hypothetical protein
MLLLSPARRQDILDAVLARTEHVELAADPRFEKTFVESMRFPSPEVAISPEPGRPAPRPPVGSAGRVRKRY